MTEPAPGIHRIPCPLGDRVVTVHLLRGPEATVLVDCGDLGHAESAIAPALSRLGLGFGDLDAIVVTHADGDHVGGLAEIRRLARRAEVVAHRLDAPLIEDGEALIDARYRFAAAHGIDAPASRVRDLRARYRPVAVDLRVEGGETVALGPRQRFELIHLPGHSAGHLGLVDRAAGIALIGDALLGAGVPTADGAGVALPPPYHDLDGYLASAARVATLDPRLLLCGHWDPIVGTAACRAFVAETTAFPAALERELSRLLADGVSRTLPELCAELPERLGATWPRASDRHLAAPLLSHLAGAEREGRAVREGSGWRSASRPT